MDVIFPCCAGLDVPKLTVVACVLRQAADGQVTAQRRTFGTMTADLLALADWLAAAGVTHVAMEATGVYWQPVWHLLEDRFTLLLVNAQQVQKVPGRKTDIQDAEWLAQLMQHGLLRGSFVPPQPIRALRDLTRQRTQLIRQKATVANRIQKVLEDANIKLASVASDMLGVSGRAILDKLIRGATDPEELANCARGRLREKVIPLQRALTGRVSDHHRFLLGMLLEQVQQIEGLIGRFDARIAEAMIPFADAAQRLMTIPGISRQAAEVIIAEIGTDMSRFPTAGHLCSWAGMSPRNDVSAGKRRSGKTTKGSVWLRTLLIQVAWAASHTKATFLSATYRRWAKRLGKKKALVALGHKMLVIIYEMLSRQTDYVEHLDFEEAA
jgi:transposase